MSDPVAKMCRGIALFENDVTSWQGYSRCSTSSYRVLVQLTGQMVMRKIRTYFTFICLLFFPCKNYSQLISPHIHHARELDDHRKHIPC